MGKTDIEDALLRLENAILEETRMAAAEALKGIHVLQGVVEDDISQKGINSTQIAVQLVIFTIQNIFMVRCRERSNSDGK